MINKRILQTAMVLVAGIMMSATVAAKEMKIGFVDVQAVASKLPQAAALQQTIRAEFGSRMEAVEKLEKDINFNIEKLRRDGPTMSQKQQEELSTTLNNQRQQYEQLARPLQEELRNRQTEERNKLLGLIQSAIDEVASRDKYDVILNSGAAVYAKPEYDISDAVVSIASKKK
jgi:outer membrane protein